MSEPLTRYKFYYPGAHRGIYHFNAAMREHTDGEWVKAADIVALKVAYDLAVHNHRQQLLDVIGNRHLSGDQIALLVQGFIDRSTRRS